MPRSQVVFIEIHGISEYLVPSSKLRIISLVEINYIIHVTPRDHNYEPQSQSPVILDMIALGYSCIYWDLLFSLGFSHSSVGKESACNAGDPGLIPGLGRSPIEGTGY